MASLIKTISEINSVCGNEKAIREFILNNIKADEITVDTMGNVIAFKKGYDSKKRLLISANMDECGFIVTKITDKGYLKFDTVGNIDLNTIISKKVVIGEEKICGVIGMKAIHLQTKDERENTVPAKNLFIDIGAKSKKDAEKQIKLGDFISFNTECDDLGENIKGKSLSRIGLYALLKNMKKTPQNDTYFAFTVQKEVGMRGAEVIARRVLPDVVITVDTAFAEDMYKCEKNGVSLGDGVIINAMDKKSIYDFELVRKAEKTAKTNNIPHKISVNKNDFSDGGAFQYGADGARVLNISIPCRYKNTPIELINKHDLEALCDMLLHLTEEL